MHCNEKVPDPYKDAFEQAGEVIRDFHHDDGEKGKEDEICVTYINFFPSAILQGRHEKHTEDEFLGRRENVWTKGDLKLILLEANVFDRRRNDSLSFCSIHFCLGVFGASGQVTRCLGRQNFVNWLLW